MRAALLITTCCAALFLAQPALAQPVTPDPAPDAGLPGGPALPSDASAEDDAAETDGDVRLTDVGLAVGRYIAGVVTEETEVYAGEWFTWRQGPKTGLALRFTTKRLAASVDAPLTDGAPGAHRIRFEDMIAGRVLVDVLLDERRLEGERVRDERLGAGYRFGDGTIARFEVKGFRDDAAETGIRRYRALLEPSFVSFPEIELLDGAIAFGRRVRIGIERANIDGARATRGVLGSDLSVRLGDVDEVHLTVNVDTEVSYGVGDGSSFRRIQPSLGASNTVSVAWTDPDRYGLGVDWSTSRDGFTADKKSKDVLRRATYTAHGFLTLDAERKYRLRTDLTLERVRDRLNPNLPTEATRWRAALAADLNRFTVGASVGRDLDGVVRPRVEAGIRIPLGRR